MAGRKVRDADEARACLAAVAASHLTLAQWARSRGLDGRSLNLWKVNLTRPGPAVPPDLRLVELVAAEPAPHARYAVRVGDFAVEVGDTFDDGVLRRLLRVVASC